MCRAGRRTAAVGSIPGVIEESDGADTAVVLMYHRVDRAERDRWSLCVPPERFDEQVAYLVRRFELLRVSDLAEALAAGALTGKAALTLDDGYRDNLVNALPILSRHGAPATFFVTGEGVAEGAPFWWEVLDRSMHAMALDEDESRALHRRLRDLPAPERQREMLDLPAAAGELPARLSVVDLGTLGREPLIEIGSHGWEHRSFASMPAEEQRAQMKESLRFLAATTGRTVRTFAYPFGMRSDSAEALLRELGIVAACTTESAATHLETDPLRLPRLEVGDWSAAELEARLDALLAS